MPEPESYPLRRALADQAAILGAFFQRDMMRWLSNRVDFLLDLMHLVISAAAIGFLGHVAIRDGKIHFPEAQLSGAPDYLSFLLVGQFIMMLTFGAQRNVSRLMLSREFANLYASPARLPVLLVGANAWRYIILFSHAAALLVVGCLAFGLRLHFTDGVIAVVVCAFVLMMSFDLISAGLRVAVKGENDPINWVIFLTGQLLAGTLYPVTGPSFPGWLRWLSNFHPQRHANDLARLTLGGGRTLAEVWPVFRNFLAASVFFLAVGLAVFSWGFRKARRDGTLGHL